MSAQHRNQSQRALIGELGEPAAEKIAKMQGTCLRIAGLSQIWASFPNARLPIQKTLAIHRMMREFFDLLQWLAHKNQFETAPFYHAEYVYPINSEGIVSHHPHGVYLIIAEENTACG